MKKSSERDRMYVCEVKAAYQTPSGIELRWKKADVELSADTDQIRCAHCSGAVRVHRKRKPDGVRDHVEHRSRQDSENCKAGYYFEGVHARSLSPVL
jgi:hypothetical protein